MARNFQWKMWIGATDIETEGTFVWQDGTPVEWTHWKASERIEHCANRVVACVLNVLSN